ncbi:MAG: carboxypeptidase-like regulatory domain-containing protein [Vicinamibacterales bacterium]
MTVTRGWIIATWLATTASLLGAVSLDVTAADRRRPVGAQARGAISGIVVDDRGAPVGRTLIGLARGGRVVATTTAAADGRFGFDDLPAARYGLSLSRAGHVSAAFGQTGPGTAPILIPLTDGQRRDVRATLVRSAVLAGRVVDASGTPIPGASVSAPSCGTNEHGSGTTGPDGRFRLFGLRPGTCTLQASLPEMTGREIVVAGPPEGTIGYQVTYHPGTTDVRQATRFRLGPGDVVDGLTFALVTEPMARIDGVVVNATSMPFSSIRAEWHPDTEWYASPFGVRSAPVRPDGSFTLRAVPAGRHVVTVTARRHGSRGQPNPAPLWATAAIVTSGEPASLTLTLAEGMTVSGRYVFDGQGEPPDLAGRSPQLRGRGGAMSAAIQSAPVTRSADGFSISGVAPAEFSVAFDYLPPPWRLIAAELDGVDVIDGTFTVAPGRDVRNLVLTLTDRTTSLSGRVADSSGRPAFDRPLVVYPVDPRLRVPRSRRIALVQPDLDGSYAIEDLPPGEYLAAALPGFFDPQDEPDRLTSLDAGAVRVILVLGAPKVLDIRR